MSEITNLSSKLELLTDPYAKKILAGCYKRPMTAQEISWEYNIPIAATYRRLNDLEDVGLIEKANVSTGSKATRYHTALERAILKFEDGRFSVKMKLGEKEMITEF